MLVNPDKHPHVKKELGQQFIDWLVSPEGQKAIADYKIDGAAVVLPERQRAGRVMRGRIGCARGRARHVSTACVRRRSGAAARRRQPARRR